MKEVIRTIKMERLRSPILASVKIFEVVRNSDIPWLNFV